MKSICSWRWKFKKMFGFDISNRKKKNTWKITTIARCLVVRSSHALAGSGDTTATSVCRPTRANRKLRYSPVCFSAAWHGSVAISHPITGTRVCALSSAVVCPLSPAAKVVQHCYYKASVPTCQLSASRWKLGTTAVASLLKQKYL